MTLYFKYIKMVIHTILEYRMSFWLLTVAQFLVAFFAFTGVFLLFERFGNISGWSFAEVALCFGVAHVAYSIAECLARGFDMFSRMITTGDFDRVLLRPRSTILQVMGTGFEMTRIGNLVQGVVVLGIALFMGDIAWDTGKIFTLGFMIVSGVFVFIGIFILGAALCFFTVEGLEVINVFTNGGQELASYPMTIYAKPVIRFFTFVIPFGGMNYLPLLYLTGRLGFTPVWYMFTPLLGIFFIVPCLLAWRFGVRHYKSTGS